MSSGTTGEEFLKVSRHLENVLTNADSPVGPVEMLLISRGCWRGWLEPWTAKIKLAMRSLSADAACSAVSFRPWKNHPEIVCVCATAHECAAWMLQEIDRTLFPDNPNFGSLSDPATEAKVDRYLKRHEKRIKVGIAKLEAMFDGPEWMRIVAQMGIERGAFVEWCNSQPANPEKSAESRAERPKIKNVVSGDLAEFIKFLKAVKPPKGKEARCSREFCERHGLKPARAKGLMRQAREHREKW